jgi:NADPH-dependent glutamate synthase beta subunit-like oxidoreductase/Pyruvate/2-oxoacid:ferredoxin oxidoreductase delta subunit
VTDTTFTYRRYEDTDRDTTDLDIKKKWSQEPITIGESYACPTYVHKTPPCQGSCPSGHDIRGWLSIVRGIDTPPEGMEWQEYAFQRMVTSNPFPAVMGRVCPAPCQDGCNRNELDDYVGINSIEQYIGDWAIENKTKLPTAGADTGKKIAVVGSGPAGLAAAYFLRLQGHAVTLFEEYEKLGGMMIYGIPNYRTPRDVLDAEINRIIDMGVEVKTSTRVGRDISFEDISTDFDAVLWGIGTPDGRGVPVPGGENAPNCTDAMSFLRAYNNGKLQYLSGRILVIGAGDSAMDVVAVAKRIGNIDNVSEENLPENVILGKTQHDPSMAKDRKPSEAWLIYRRPIAQAPCTPHELKAVIEEGVEIHDSISPMEVMLDDNGRARALKVAPVEVIDGEMKVKEDEAYEIECTMIVGATGQQGDYEGLEELNNGRNLIDSDATFQVTSKPGQFVAGDAVRPHLLTTAIGQASVAVAGISDYLQGQDISKRPKVDKHHFSIGEELTRHNISPTEYNDKANTGTDNSTFAIHNYEDRSDTEVIDADELYLGHFKFDEINNRQEVELDSEQVLSNFEERFKTLNEDTAQKEADRCMSCGMCFECDNCVIYCPQDAIYRVKKDQHAIGRYVATDYSKCVGCHICQDVCPTGYIKMGLGSY